MNNSCIHWNIFESQSDWNIITLAITNTNKTEKDDEVFGTILRGVKTLMSKNTKYIVWRNENS